MFEGKKTWTQADLIDLAAMAPDAAATAVTEIISAAEGALREAELLRGKPVYHVVVLAKEGTDDIVVEVDLDEANLGWSAVVSRAGVPEEEVKFTTGPISQRPKGNLDKNRPGFYIT